MSTPTLRDVAALAGVSVSTVSRVLNDKPGVTADKRARIEQALQELDYVSNVSARTLRGTRSRTYALLVDDLATAFFSDLAESLTRIVLDEGCTLLIVTTQKTYDRERRIVAEMRARHVDGLFVVAASGDAGIHRARQPSSLPVVYVERFPPGVEADVVTFDYYRAGLEQIDRLWADGHRRIAFLGGNVAEDPGQRRLAAFRDGLRAHGVIVDAELISTGHLTEDEALPALQRLRALPDPPTALVVTVAPLLRPALRLAAQDGWEITIASYESIDLPQLTPVPLIVTHGDLDALARTAAETMQHRISAGSQETSDARTILLETSLDRYGPS